jgi:hypothetical protein
MIRPMNRLMMENVEANKDKKYKSLVVFTLFALSLPLAFIIERPIFQMYPGISPI